MLPSLTLGIKVYKWFKEVSVYLGNLTKIFSHVCNRELSSLAIPFFYPKILQSKLNESMIKIQELKDRTLLHDTFLFVYSIR